MVALSTPPLEQIKAKMSLVLEGWLMNNNWIVMIWFKNVSVCLQSFTIPFVKSVHCVCSTARNELPGLTTKVNDLIKEIKVTRIIKVILEIKVTNDSKLRTCSLDVFKKAHKNKAVSVKNYLSWIIIFFRQEIVLFLNFLSLSFCFCIQIKINKFLLQWETSLRNANYI